MEQSLNSSIGYAGMKKSVTLHTIALKGIYFIVSIIPSMLQSGRNGIGLARGKTISTSSCRPQSAAYIIGFFSCCIVKIKMKEVIQSHMKHEMIKAIQGLFFYKKA